MIAREKAINAHNKWLLTEEPYFVEKLGGRRLSHFTQFFSLWSGHHVPFFKICDRVDPKGEVVCKWPVQVRPLPIRDQAVANELEAFVTRSSILYKNLPSCVEVNESGPLRTVLAGIKHHLYKQVQHFKDDGVKGILRNYLFSLQPEHLTLKLPLKKIEIETKNMKFNFNFEVRVGTNERFCHSEIKTTFEDLEARVERFRRLLPFNEELLDYEIQLTPYQRCIMGHIIERMKWTPASFYQDCFLFEEVCHVFMGNYELIKEPQPFKPEI